MMCSVPDLDETLDWVGEVWPSEEEDTYGEKTVEPSHVHKKNWDIHLVKMY